MDPALADLPLAGIGGTVARARLAGSGILLRFLRLPWWLQVGLVWLAGRAYSVVLVLWALHNQPDVPVLAGKLTYLGYSNIWDAAFYEQIHDVGYPAQLPRDAAGNPQGTVWAFLPVYPLLVRGVTTLTGLSWATAAVAVSVLASLAFTLLAYRFFRTRADHGASILATTLISFWTAAAVYGFGYAEALSLAGLAALLLLLARGRYLLAAPLVILVGLTRPMGVALAGMCIVVAVLVVVGYRRAGRPIRPRDGVALAILVASGLVGAVLWPAIAAAVTGVPNAYLASEAGWHGNTVYGPLQLFAASVMVQVGVAAAPVVILLAVVTCVLVWLSRPVRELGAVAWSWTGCWVGYLFVVAPWDTTWFRLLLAAFPLALAAVTVSRARAYRWLLVVVAVVSQAVWVLMLWFVGYGPSDLRP